MLLDAAIRVPSVRRKEKVVRYMCVAISGRSIECCTPKPLSPDKELPKSAHGTGDRKDCARDVGKKRIETSLPTVFKTTRSIPRSSDRICSIRSPTLCVTGLSEKRLAYIKKRNYFTRIHSPTEMVSFLPLFLGVHQVLCKHVKSRKSPLY